MNYLDLFSGIGGFHLGLENAGFKFNQVFNSEIDKYANAIYKHKFPRARAVGSVCDLKGSDLPDIHGITFGSPCQDLSLVGKRKGLAGDRSSLFYQAIRLIREKQPLFFIWENVKGAFSSNGGEDFIAILKAFADLGNYECEWELLNTRWFLPQNRERIYLVGHLRGSSFGKVFPIGDNGRLPEQEIKTRRRQSQTSICGTITNKFGARADSTYVKVISRKGENKKNQDYAATLTAGGHSGGNHSDMDLIKVGTWRTHKDGSGFREIKGGNCPTIPARAREDGSGQPVIIQRARGFNKGGEFNISPSITTSSFERERIRRLTPIECERLQGFPDNHTKHGNFDGEVKEISDTQRYKCIGNSVTTNVVEAIGRKLLVKVAV